MGCGKGLARIFVFIVNFLFLLVGLGLLVVGVIYQVNFTKLTDVIPSELSAVGNVPIFAIVVGSIILVISFLGCCGAFKNNTCMLSWYGGILIAIFLLQVALGIYAFLKYQDLNDFKSQITQQLEQVFAKNESGVVDQIQQTLQCCGTDGPSYWTNDGLDIPESCYSSDDTPYEDGCLTVLTNYLSTSIRTLAIVAIAVSTVEVVGAVLALCLTNCIRKERQPRAYY